MGEIEEASNYMMYQNADLKELNSTDGATYGTYGSEPVAYPPTAAVETAAAAAADDSATAVTAAAEKVTNGEEEEVKELTELEKYWKTVKDNPSDFTGWTYLLQFVEQENNLDGAREAFQEFFKNYPYCYGYWKKFADLEKKNQNFDKCVEVFEQGLKAIPLSVDLWLHYIAYYRTQETGEDAPDKTRALFEKAIKAVGLEFRSDRLWEMYVAYETEQQNHRNTMIIYDRLINTPTQLYSHQFEKFEEFTQSHHPKDILDPDELAALVLETKKPEIKKETPETESEKERKEGEEAAPTSDVPEIKMEAIMEAADGVKDAVNDTVSSTEDSAQEKVTLVAEGEKEASTVTEPAIPDSNGLSESADESAETLAAVSSTDVTMKEVTDGASEAVTKEGKAHTDTVELSEEQIQDIRSRLSEKMRAIHKANEEEVSKRWNFEEGIKRPYFHVKPLETTQLSNWREYLDFEMGEGDRERICILFERCLIACALYEEMWQKYIAYLETVDEVAAGEVYERACTIHLRSKPNIQLMWASFEERSGRPDKSEEVLEQMEKLFPGYLPITFRRINLTRRRNKLDETESLYKKYAEAAKSPQIASLYALKQARFRHKLLHDEAGAVTILREALLKDKDNARLYMQLIDIYYQSTPIKEEMVVEAFDGALSSDMAVEAKILFAQRKVEFLEDLGSDINRLQEAHNALCSFVKMGADKRKRTTDEETEEPSAKRIRTEAVNGAVAPVAAAAVAPAADQAAAYGYYANYAQNYGYQNAWNMYGQQYYPQQ